jgi:hypothetical protein
MWGMWALMGRGLLRMSGDKHPPTNDERRDARAGAWWRW